MNKIILLGHPSSGLQEVEALLLSSGMQTPLPSKRLNQSPGDVVQTLCQAHQCAEVSEVTTESDFSPIKAGEIWRDLALDLLLGNLHQNIWGWADTRNIYWLNYWAELDPHVTFVMVYDHPSKALQAMSVQRGAQPSEMEVTRLLENWQAYNSAMLSFYSRHASRCLLVNASCAPEQLQAYLDLLGAQLHGNVSKLNSRAFVAPNANATERLSFVEEYLLNQLLQEYPVVLQTFEEIEASSTVPCVRLVSEKVNPVTAWVEHIQQLQITSDYPSKALEEENELLLMQLHQVQEELERYYLEYQSLKKNPVNSYGRLYGAADRIQQQLTYRLGATLIANSRSLGGWLRMPFALRREVRAYRVDMSKKGNQNLPPIHSYADAYEAERCKQHLSYKLGQTLLKHNKTPWGWFVLPFAMLSTIKNFKKARS